jgi:hypothetical protein
MMEILVMVALIAMSAAAGYQVGFKHGEAFTFRLARHRVDLHAWYAEEPRVIERARASELLGSDAS